MFSGRMAMILALAGNIASVSAEAPPPFKVTAQDRTTLVLLVPSETPSEQLKHLILALRQARRENKLGQLLPPTTPGGSRGPYGIVDVYVYSEPEWATVAALQKCLHASANTPLSVECGKHVRARYFYGLQPEDEEGSVGYAEGKRIYTKHYQKLF